MCCKRRALFAAVLCLLLVVAAGCDKNIPNTTVKDTPENRAVITFMENYRNSVEARDVGALLAMAHPQYLDDNGTPSGDDDIDRRSSAAGASGSPTSDTRSNTAQSLGKWTVF
jgi:hypothetical protein